MSRDIRVLLVEDGADDADFAQSVLSGSRTPTFTVHRVASRREAVRYLVDHAVDVVLLDLSLPDGRGLDALVAVRDVSEYPAIVVLTGSDDSMLANACLDAGAQDYLHKDQIDGHSLKRAIGYAVHRLEGERRRAVTRVASTYRAVTDRAVSSQAVSFQAVSSQAVSSDTGGPPAGPAAPGDLGSPAPDPDRFRATVDAYTALWDGYLEAVRLHRDHPRERMAEVVAAIAADGGGPRDLIEVHVASLERAVAREPEARAGMLAVEGRLMALEMMGILVDHYRLGHGGEVGG